MNTEAYLTSQGWQGYGHALHHSGRGIIKPLNISHKANLLGVGKKQHDIHADQWWARAFDDMLKGLNTTKNEATGKNERVSVGSDTPAVQCVETGGTMRIRPGSLYSNFVKGESLSGTLIPEAQSQPETQPQSEDYMKQERGSSDADCPAVVSMGVTMSKKRPRQREGAAAEDFELMDLNAVHQDPKYVELQRNHLKPRERPKDTESNEQGRQKKKKKGAKRSLQAGASLELLKQPRTTTSSNNLTSHRLNKRSME